MEILFHINDEEYLHNFQLTTYFNSVLYSRQITEPRIKQKPAHNPKGAMKST
jgi:cytochrome b